MRLCYKEPEMTELDVFKYLAQLISYSPELGDFVWKDMPISEPCAIWWNPKHSGKLCGTINDAGYLTISITKNGKRKTIRAHRLAWFLVYGVSPRNEIDHINHIRSDNRICNLRDVTRELNQRNGTMKSTNTSGVTGVYWRKNEKKWGAQCNLNGKHFNLGSFESFDDAACASKSFRLRNGFSENHGGTV